MYHSVVSMYGNMGRGNKPIRLRLQEKEKEVGWSVASQNRCQRGKKVLVHWCLVSEALILTFEAYATASNIIILWCSMQLWTPLTNISPSLKSAIDLQLPYPVQSLSLAQTLWVVWFMKWTPLLLLQFYI